MDMNDEELPPELIEKLEEGARLFARDFTELMVELALN
jgi:hypothetical protein